MTLYIQVNDEQYEKFKAFMKKPNLEDYSASELAAALLGRIRKEGGRVDDQDNTYDYDPTNRKKTTTARLNDNNFIISLIVEKY